MASLISQLIPQLNNKSQEIVTQNQIKSDGDDTHHQAKPSLKIAYTIAHALPGRVRFHVPRIAQDPEYRQRLEKLLKADDWVTTVRVNRAAASIVITYKPGAIASQELRSRSPKDSMSVGEALLEGVELEHLASVIQSAGDAIVATDAPVASTQEVTQEPASFYFHPQPATQSTILTGSSEVKQDAISSRCEASTIPTANTVSDSRVFLYEVEGWRQSEETEKMNYPIRSSGSVFIRVPSHRMNQEMQRITRLGGKIVSINSA